MRVRLTLPRQLQSSKPTNAYSTKSSVRAPTATSTRTARSARAIHVNSITPACAFASTDQTTQTKRYSSRSRNAPRARRGRIEAFGWGPSGLLPFLIQRLVIFSLVGLHPLPLHHFCNPFPMSLFHCHFPLHRYVRLPIFPVGISGDM
jgi:hypothetical protein